MEARAQQPGRSKAQAEVAAFRPHRGARGRENPEAGERVPGAADVSASGRETDGSTAEQCQGAGGDRGARACGARACGTRRPPASPPESLAFLNI